MFVSQSFLCLEPSSCVMMTHRCSGASCPYSHGTGLQTADDVTAALLAASFLHDPETQIAVALAGTSSLTLIYRAYFVLF